jgi:hypothetical protein
MEKEKTDEVDSDLRAKISRVVGITISPKDKWEIYFNKLDVAGRLNIKYMAKMLAVFFDEVEKK